MKTNIENTQSLLHDFGLSAKKSLGQNFLISQKIVDKIVEGATITKEDVVIEIGPGIGALSEELCKKAKKVYLFEIDKSFELVLNSRLKHYDNYELFIIDFLKVDIEKFINENKIKEKIILVSNLPYYITSKLLLQIFRYNSYIKNVVVMMQKDVGVKLISSDSNKEKNALSIMIKTFSNTKKICVVSCENFIPQPHIDSLVLRFEILDKPRYKIINKNNLPKRLNSLFIQRRKTIAKNLTTIINDKEKIDFVLNKCEISPLTRVEQLSEEKIIELCNVIEEL